MFQRAAQALAPRENSVPGLLLSSSCSENIFDFVLTKDFFLCALCVLCGETLLSFVLTKSGFTLRSLRVPAAFVPELLLELNIDESNGPEKSTVGFK